jgi:aconitate hydratase
VAHTRDPFGVRDTLEWSGGRATVYRLDRLAEREDADLDRLPFSIRVLLENVLRSAGDGIATEAAVRALLRWSPAPGAGADVEVPFRPTRVLLQDFTGVPAVVDLAALRSAMARAGGDPERIDPVVPADLVIDHSVQVDEYGTPAAFLYNVEREIERNRERYQLLKWAQGAFRNFRVVPPGTGIVHQVNLEYLATVVDCRAVDGEDVAFPDTLVGTDSHTTMVNGLGVLGWGVGGIEAEAVLLGEPYFLSVPEVVGVKLTGALPEGATATDLVLHVTELLRRTGVVGRFVEFFGPGLGTLSLADRATIANMAPEYGATCGFFPVDAETLRYLAQTGRDPELVDRVERYTKLQRLFRTDGTPDPEYTQVVGLDLGTVEPSLAGPRRPQDRVPLRDVARSFRAALAQLAAPKGARPTANEVRWTGEGGNPAEPGAEGGGGTAVTSATAVEVALDGERFELDHGSVVIAAITSCTNTSNPSVMVGAGLLAKKAVERGLRVKPWVKTSLAPGSRVVTDYLQGSGLLPALEALRFHVVGYGCTTCIGNSGPLPDPIADAIRRHGLVTVAVLSGNRNFEARIHPLVRANYLASPILVVAYALAGRIDVNLLDEPIGTDTDGRPVYLREIWPSPDEIRRAVTGSLRPELFRQRYAHVFEGDEPWQALDAPAGLLYAWDPASTYIQEPPFVRDLPDTPPPPADLRGARVLAVLGDSVTTDHISPAGSIPQESPAGRYLVERGVRPRDFNTYGARRGNHEVMVRGTFANVRIRNRMVPDREGGWTVHVPSGEVVTIYEAAMRYAAEGTPLLVLAGKEYGAGSSRDWAAKGPALLGVRAVLAESYERIHRSNLVGMGVLPLQFEPGANVASLGLTGRERYDVLGIAQGLEPGGRVRVLARPDDGGAPVEFEAIVRLDTDVDREYYRHGGILPYVLRKLRGRAGAEPAA